jgi:hypothetical protein
VIILVYIVNRVANWMRSKLMTRRRRSTATGQFVVNGRASSRQRYRTTVKDEPVTSERIFESLRYLNEDAFRRRAKK